MAKNEKRQAAKDLYMTGEYTQQRISAMLGVTPNTISKWVKDDNWEGELDEHTMLQNDILTDLRFLLRRDLKIMRAKAERDDATVKSGDIESIADLRTTDKGEIDGLSKLFAQFKRKELSNSDKIQIIDLFLKYVEGKDLSFAKELIQFTDGFRDKILNVK
jgi:predicted transcriptional regulator